MAATETTYCPNCGEQISARAKFCPSCGARQEDYRIPPRAPEPPAEPPPAAAAQPEPPPPAAPEPPSPAPESPVAGPSTESAAAADDPSPVAPATEPEPPAAAAAAESPRAAAAGETPPSARDQAPRREPRPLHERIGEVDPQAAELTQLIAGRLALPGIVAAGLAALIAAGIVLAAGLVIAFITPDASIVGILGRDVNVVTEAFRQAVGTLLAPVVVKGPFSSGSGRLTPLILVAIPIGAVAFATRRQLHRTEGAQPLIRLGWAALVAVPFAVLMLVFAVLGGHTDSTGISTSPGSAFGLGLLWGAIGGIVGAAPALELGAAVPEHRIARAALPAVAATLRPLAAVLVTSAALGLVAWLAGVGAAADQARGGRSAATALIEETAFVGEDGVHVAELGAGARFHTDGPGALGLPIPVSKAANVPGGDGRLRIFSYNDALPAYVFLPGLIIMMGLVALGALYAGFAAARAAGAGSLVAGAAWGALTGPVWAVAMTILNALAGGFFHGAAESGSVFAVFVLGGALLGAGGGALAQSA
jgi:zinc-ribbon domain